MLAKMAGLPSLELDGVGKDCWLQIFRLGICMSLVGDSDTAVCGWRALLGGKSLVRVGESEVIVPLKDRVAKEGRSVVKKAPRFLVN
jgi:hypothetical protein